MYSMDDGVLILTDCPTPFTEALSTAAPFDNKDGHVGTAFRANAPLYRVPLPHPQLGEEEKTGSTGCSVSFWSGDQAKHVGVNKEMLGTRSRRDDRKRLCGDGLYLVRRGRQSRGFGYWCDAGSVGDACLICPPVGFDYG